MKEEEGEEWRAMKAGDGSDGQQRRQRILTTLKPCATVSGEGGEDKGWKAARRRRTGGGRRRMPTKSNRIWWGEAG